jgi:hypothetical protein
VTVKTRQTDALEDRPCHSDYCDESATNREAAIFPTNKKRKDSIMISASHFASIAALDLQPISTRLMHPEAGEGWSPEKTCAVELEYRRFLYLMKLFPNEPTAPVVDVDTFWHYHILDTAKYAADCKQTFGYFLHHNPYIGLRGEGDEEVLHYYGERMRELYVETFGDVDGQYATAYSAAVPVNSATGQPAYFTAAASAYCTRGESAYCTRGESAYCTRGPSAYGTAAPREAIRNGAALLDTGCCRVGKSAHPGMPAAPGKGAAPALGLLQ